MNAEFQRIARKDKKDFLSDQCKEIDTAPPRSCSEEGLGSATDSESGGGQAIAQRRCRTIGVFLGTDVGKQNPRFLQ